MASLLKSMLKKKNGKTFDVIKTFDAEGNLLSKQVKENGKIAFKSNDKDTDKASKTDNNKGNTQGKTGVYQELIEVQKAVYRGENPSDANVRFADSAIFETKKEKKKRAAYANAAQSAAKEQISANDANKDGVMNYDEYLDEQMNFYDSIIDNKEINQTYRAEYNKEMQTIFGQMDLNNDGVLDSKELAVSFIAMDASTQKTTELSLNTPEYSLDGNIDVSNIIEYQNLGDRLKELYTGFFGNEEG